MEVVFFEVLNQTLNSSKFPLKTIISSFGAIEVILKTVPYL